MRPFALCLALLALRTSAFADATFTVTSRHTFGTHAALLGLNPFRLQV
jgi:hypothetical protein